MSRTRHTDPRRVRAARRVRSPRSPRAEGDPSTRADVGRALKALGCPVAPGTAPAGTPAEVRLPRIRITRPRSGFHHPLSRSLLREALLFFGEPCFYGLRSVELRQRDSDESGLVLGRLVVPGHVVLYEQRRPPWKLAGSLGEPERRRLEVAGAQVDSLAGGLHVEVDWPGETLEEFMLLDVLMHEIGHHILQHHEGKRPTRIARTADHESRADAFARHCRQLWHDFRRSGP